MTYCKNCGGEITKNFCPNCGQKIVHKLSFKSVIHDLTKGLTTTDKGALNTIKQLFTRPGKMIAEYLDGKRVQHTNPVSLLIILVTVYLLISHWLGMDKSIKMTSEEVNLSGLSTIINLAPIRALLSIPFAGLASWWLFKKKYNYVENVYIAIFISIQTQVLSFVFDLALFPLVSLSIPAFDIKKFEYLPTFILGFCFTIWDFKQLFAIKWGRAIWKTILYYTIASILLILFIAILVFLIGILNKNL